MTANGPSTAMVDPNVPQRAASDPDWSVWVSASAGTGKTRVLTNRVLRLLLDGTPPARILCLTFTKAAAAEMSNRIRAQLASWAIATPESLAAALAGLSGGDVDPEQIDRARRLFADVLEAPGGLPIMTLHAFCQSLLRRFPLEAGLSPHFSVMEAQTAAELRVAVRDQIIDKPDPVIADALSEIADRIGEEAFTGLIEALLADRSRLELALDTHGGVDAVGPTLRRQLGLGEGESEAAILSAFCDDASFDGPSMRRAADALLQSGASDVPRGSVMADWLEATPIERARQFDAYLRVYLTEKSEPRKRLATKKAETVYPQIQDVLGKERDRVILTLDRRRSAVLAQSTAALLTVGSAFTAAYDAAKAHRGLLDFDDLIMRAGLLLIQHGVTPWVLFKLDGGIDHVLIDEAQDTSPEQWRLIAALTDEFFAGAGARLLPRTVFAVGDVKQSIYSFQRADPAEFVRMRDHFASRAQQAQQSWRSTRLDVSFRSTRAVLDLVDAVFALESGRDGVVFDGEGVLRHETMRVGQAGSVTLWPLVGPETPEEAEPWALPVEQGRGLSPSAALARRLASTIAGWLGTGDSGGSLWLEARGRPALAGDILILVRTRNRLFAEIVRALKDSGVPVSGVDRMVVPDQLAVMDLIALARFLLLPEDDLTLATVLKTPLIGVDEAQLFAIAHDRPGSLWAALRDRSAGDPLLEAACTWLSDWLRQVDYVGPFDLLSAILALPCPADSISGRRAMLRRLGSDAEDPMDELLGLALQFEQSEPPSLQRFVHWLEKGRTEVKRELEAGPQSRVRIMTVHGAKGLQAPIVILPDTVSTPKAGPALLWPDDADGLPLWPPRRADEESLCRTRRAEADRRRDQEYRRLLYVALTRAEDRLLICGHRRKAEPAAHCWYSLCRQALDEMPGATADVDGALSYAVEQRGRALASAEPPGEPDVAPLPAFFRQPPPEEPGRHRPLQPSRSDSDTEPAALSLLAESGPSPVREGGERTGRERRFARGLLIHDLLRRLPDVPSASRSEFAARLLRRAGVDDPVTAKGLVSEVMAVLDDADFKPVFGPGSRAEVPLAGQIGDRVISGTIDRLLVQENGVLVIDYKTERRAPTEIAAVPRSYIRQMAAYRSLLQAIYPDRPISCGLIWTEAPTLMTLPADVLDPLAPDSGI